MVFNSRDSFYKNPCGAVEHGTDIVYKLKLSKELSVSTAFLSIAKDGDAFSDFEMQITESFDDFDIFEVTFNANMGFLARVKL